MKAILFTISLLLVQFTNYSQITFNPYIIDDSQATANAANSVTAADFDGDGDVDIVGAAFQSDVFSLYRNDGSTNFTQETIDDSATLSNGARFVTSFDLDEDGDMDVLAAASVADNYLWFENDGTGGFTPHLIDNSPLSNEAYAIDAADFNSDGTMDIVGGANAGDALAVYSNDGDENFSLLVDLSASANGTNGVRAVKAVDLNDDANMDILVAAFAGDTFIWFEGDGSGNFIPHVIDDSLAANGATAIDAGDMDDDGDLDLVCASNVADQYVWYENDGNENFTFHIIDNSTFSDGPRGLTLNDLDRDNDLDVIVASLSQDTFAWYENNGSGNFTSHLISSVPTYTNGAFAVVAADIDGDTIDDIISAANIADAFSWFNTVGVVLNTPENLLAGIVIYPNPTRDLIHIKAPMTLSLGELRITDSNGRVVYEDLDPVHSNLEINLETLAGGLYFVSVESVDGRFTAKIIKQ